MVVFRDEEIALTASFSGEQRPLTDSNLLRAWAGTPAMTFAVLARIHWEALKMWPKGVRYLGHAHPPQRVRRSEPTPPIAAPGSQ